jgi:hypothetical protein
MTLKSNAFLTRAPTQHCPSRGSCRVQTRRTSHTSEAPPCPTACWCRDAMGQTAARLYHRYLRQYVDGASHVTTQRLKQVPHFPRARQRYHCGNRDESIELARRRHRSRHRAPSRACPLREAPKGILITLVIDIVVASRTKLRRCVLVAMFFVRRPILGSPSHFRRRFFGNSSATAIAKEERVFECCCRGADRSTHRQYDLLISVSANDLEGL